VLSLKYVHLVERDFRAVHEAAGSMGPQGHHLVQLPAVQRRAQNAFQLVRRACRATLALELQAAALAGKLDLSDALAVLDPASQRDPEPQ
jgi:hypothetical protein